MIAESVGMEETSQKEFIKKRSREQKTNLNEKESLDLSYGS